MKKLYTTLVAVLAITHLSFGQWTTNASTNDAYNNNVSGKVGIGTITPKAKLDVTTGTSALTSATLQTWNWVDDPNNWGLRLDQYHTGSAIDQRFIQRMGTSDLNVLTFHLGNVGVGTSNPSSRLHVNSGSDNSVITNLKLQGGEGSSSGSSLMFASSYVPVDYQTGKISALTMGWGTDFKSDLTFQTNSGSQGNSLTEKMRITSGGKLGIGTTNPDEMLTVNGKIHAREVRVDNSIPTPDYVFNKDYQLMSLADVKNYVDKNHHLPEVPSAAEVEKDGLKLGEMNLILLKKVEELTLHLIDLKKENEAIKKDNIEINKKLNALIK